MKVEQTEAGLVVRAEAYELRLNAGRLVADVLGADGRTWFRLRLLAAVDTVAGPDETLGTPAVTHHADGDGVTVEVRCASTQWRLRTAHLRCTEGMLEHWATVEGEGRVLDVHLFGGRRLPQGFLPSGSALRTVFSPNPDHPRRVARPAVEPAVVGVCGEGSEPGVGRWLFTPAPWCYAVSREPAADDVTLPDGEWAAVALLAKIEEQAFTSYRYEPVTDGFSLRLEYEGHTRVEGGFGTPRVVVLFGQPDPYTALTAHTELLAERGLLPTRGPVQPHWRQPLFCGWGAQSQLGELNGGRAQDHATRQAYDGFLAELAEHGIVPGTVVVDDKWQLEYATCRPDPAKWADLRGWVERRHADGQRVLLWWKAWDPEGAPPDACVRTPDGVPVAIDPESPAGRATVVDAVTRMLSTGGLDADGLKIDFTARTPTGVALDHAGPSWGATLLHRLLALVYDTAKAVKPDCLVVTHAANPAFADVTDLVRLNDVLMLDAQDQVETVAPHLAYRAGVVSAACPGAGIDTDGWCMPSRAEWLHWMRRQPEVGVPALYYTTHIDHTQERLTPEDLAEQARIWATYRASLGLPRPRYP